jgi:cobaltochelatase CobS
LFATANTIGLGNLNGMYHGTQLLNHAQLDRWDIVARLDYLDIDEEVAMVAARVAQLNDAKGRALLKSMVAVAQFTRNGFSAGDVGTLMSPRTVISWAENVVIFGDVNQAFALSYLNRCDEAERATVAEYYQRAFGEALGAT